MEFKKPNRQNQRRLQLEAPRRRGASPSNPRPVRPDSPTNPDITPNQPEAKTRQKTTALSRARRLLFTKKAVIILVAAVIIFLAAWLLFFRHHSGSGASNTAKTPEYETVLPDKKSIRELGGWKRISPPEKEPVFAYADTIDGVSISVSQQPLPESFKSNTDNQVAELAKKFNATSTIDAGSTKAYIGTSTKGPQSVILTKNNVLILIKSQKKISDTSWAKYIGTLD